MKINTSSRWEKCKRLKKRPWPLKKLNDLRNATGIISRGLPLRELLPPAESMTDSDSDWAELAPIERDGVQLIEFMSEYVLSRRLSGGKRSCIYLRRCSHCKSPWMSQDFALNGLARCRRHRFLWSLEISLPQWSVWHFQNEDCLLGVMSFNNSWIQLWTRSSLCGCFVFSCLVHFLCGFRCFGIGSAQRTSSSAAEHFFFILKSLQDVTDVVIHL